MAASILMLCAVNVHAQDIPLLPVSSFVLSGGLQVADQIDGQVGATIALERTFAEITKRVVLGVGASTGIRRSQFEGILGSDYSVIVIPMLGFLNAHVRIASVPRLDAYVGTAAGVSALRYKSTNCDGLTACEPDNDSVVSGGLQLGARWALRGATLTWIELAAGKNMPRVNVGLSRKF